MKPNELAHLLEPFGIHSHNHCTGPGTVVKGYYFRRFPKKLDAPSATL